jgi:hypothetical protein
MRLLLVSAVALAASVAHGEPGVVAGMGTQSCAGLNARTQPGLGYGQNSAATAAFSWVQGYVSAWNVIGIVKSGRFADLASLTADEQWSRIAEFCRNNPKGFVFDAARDILAKGLRMETVIPIDRDAFGAGEIDHSVGDR